MYQPPHFREDRAEVQHALIREYPLGLLVTAGPGGLMANPVPFLLVMPDCGRACFAVIWPVRTRRRPSLPAYRSAWSLPRAASLCDTLVVSFEAGNREGGPDVELCDRPCLGAPNCHRGRSVAAGQPLLYGSAGSGRAIALVCGRCSRRLHRRSVKGHRWRGDPDFPDRGQMEGEPEQGWRRPHRRCGRLAQRGVRGNGWAGVERGGS